jgi:hypothetical protein
MLDFLNQYANLALAVLTLLYLISTIIYVVITHRILSETRFMRIATDTAKIIGRLEPYTAAGARYALTNIGKGTAFNMALRLRIGECETNWRHKLMESNRTEYFFLPGRKISIEEINSIADHLSMSIEFDDVSGKHFSVLEDIDLRQTIRDWDSAGWSIKDTEIEKAAKQISSAIDKLASK